MFLKLAYLDHYVRPILGRFLPPRLFTNLYIKNREVFLNQLADSLTESLALTTIPTTVAGIRFRNDLGNAAGLDKDGNLLDFNYHIGAGFAVVGTVLSYSHIGNEVRYGQKNYNPWTPLPASSSALNSLGLPSKGVDNALNNIKRFQDRVSPQDFPIGLSVMGHPLDEGDKKINGVLECIKKAQGVVDFVELNESCPNVKHQTTKTQLEDRIKRTRESCDSLPLFVKFDSLNLSDGTVEMLEEYGIAGISLCNTQKNYSHFRQKLSSKDYKIFDFYTKKYSGGLSGDIIRQYSFELIENTASYLKENNLKLELMHIGGISKYEHVKQSRQYAQLRQWYTGFMEAIASQKMVNIYKNILIKG